MDDLRAAARDAYWAWYQKAPNVSEQMERLYRLSRTPQPQDVRSLKLVGVSDAEWALMFAADEGRNVLPDATDDQASVIEEWARQHE